MIFTKRSIHEIYYLGDYLRVFGTRAVLRNRDPRPAAYYERCVESKNK